MQKSCAGGRREKKVTSGGGFCLNEADMSKILYQKSLLIFQLQQGVLPYRPSLLQGGQVQRCNHLLQQVPNRAPYTRGPEEVSGGEAKADTG